MLTSFRFIPKSDTLKTKRVYYKKKIKKNHNNILIKSNLF